ncbi:hypothetical protein C0585_07395 [Candidatus Woesearchaeota archaeon]|nr:MAG: hypothetical protein C0585_07395 [Candidatus Woesearchaeota archaeon]
MRKNTKHLLIIFTLLFIFLLIFGIRYYHFSKTEQFSDDKSYYNLRQIEYISENGKPLYADTLSYGGREYFFTPVFHYFFALVYSLTGSIMALKIINNLFATSIIFFAYLLVKSITKDEFLSFSIGTIVSIIPIYIENTLNTLNPYSIFFPLMVLLTYYISLLKTDSNKYSSITTTLFALFIMLSPISLILILGFFFNQVLTKINGIKINKKEVEIFIVSLLFYLWYYFMVYKDTFFNQGLSILKQNIPKALLFEHFMIPTPLNLLISFGIVSFLFGAFSVYYVSSRPKFYQANILASTAIMITLFLFMDLLTIEIFSISLGIIITLISSVGLKLIIDYFINTKIPYSKALIFIFLVIIFVPNFFALKNIDQSTLTDERIETYEWIEINTFPFETIITPITEGHILSYFSNRKNVMDTNFLSARNIDQRFEDLRKIYMNPFYTEVIHLALEKYNARYILLDGAASKIYNIESLPSSDDECIRIAYENQKTKDLIYEIEC